MEKIHNSKKNKGDVQTGRWMVPKKISLQSSPAGLSKLWSHFWPSKHQSECCLDLGPRAGCSYRYLVKNKASCQDGNMIELHFSHPVLIPWSPSTNAFNISQLWAFPTHALPPQHRFTLLRSQVCGLEERKIRQFQNASKGAIQFHLRPATISDPWKPSMNQWAAWSPSCISIKGAAMALVINYHDIWSYDLSDVYAICMYMICTYRWFTI